MRILKSNKDIEEFKLIYPDYRGNFCTFKFINHVNQWLWGKITDESLNLINCSGCIDCEVCTNCTNCEGCESCTNCTDCKQCNCSEDCISCEGCEFYANGRNLSDKIGDLDTNQ